MTPTHLNSVAFRSLKKRQQPQRVWFCDILSAYITKTLTYFIRHYKIFNPIGEPDFFIDNVLVFSNTCSTLSHQKRSPWKFDFLLNIFLVVVAFGYRFQG